MEIIIIPNCIIHNLHLYYVIIYYDNYIHIIICNIIIYNYVYIIIVTVLYII